MSDKRPIGVFDSGVGGLSVLKELVKLMPKENYIFIADQKNVPYGEKTRKELRRVALEISDFLVSKNSKIIVVACNTATCYAIDSLRAKIGVPFVGTVPAVKPAAQKSRSGVIGIISTPATSQSAYLKKLIGKHANNVKVVNIGCPNLENTVEKGDLGSKELKLLITRYINPIKQAGADIIVLGCTHYPFLKAQIKKAGPGIELIDSGKAVAKQTKKTLQRLNALNGSGGRINFYTTGDSKLFSKVASSLLKTSVKAKHLSS